MIDLAFGGAALFFMLCRSSERKSVKGEQSVVECEVTKHGNE